MHRYDMSLWPKGQAAAAPSAKRDLHALRVRLAELLEDCSDLTTTSA